MENNKKRTALVILLMVFITFALIWLETYKRQREQFQLAEKHFQENKFHRAIQYYDATIHMYTPWSSRVKISAEKLWEIGKMYESKKEYDMALNAYRSLRSSFYAVRWLVQPYKEWIDRCDIAIARVVGIQETAQNNQKQTPVPDAVP